MHSAACAVQRAQRSMLCHLLQPASAAPRLAWIPCLPPRAHPLPPTHPPTHSWQVKAGLVPLLADLRSRGVAPSDAWLKGDYDPKQQAE